MKLFFIPILAILLSFLLASAVQAQMGQIWETTVGNPVDNTGPVYDDEGIELSKGDDELGPGRFRLPFRCNLHYVSSTYGPPKYSRPHSSYAIDINRASGGRTDEGDPVFAVADGVTHEVTFRASTSDCRSAVIIRHEGGWYSLYGHMSNFTVSKKGERVKAGQKIGEIDDICSPGQWHLHYSVFKGGLSEANAEQVCFADERYGCDRNSVKYPRSGIPEKSYNLGCL
jgi:murein DD-endopeptidase MepM/ murein hydrolase activator NlpD